MTRRLFLFILAALVLVGVGCAPETNQKPQVNPSGQIKKMADANGCRSMPHRHFDDEQQAVRLARQTDGVHEAVAVYIDNHLNVGLDVRNFHRLRLKTIRKETFDRLEKAFPDAELHVTTDSKVFRELQKMSQKPWQNDLEAACREKRRLDELEEMMKG